MNKNAIKKFAIEARKKLIESVTDKAGMLGITEKLCSKPITVGADFEVYQTVAGTEVTLNKRQCEQRRRLVSQIESRGFEAVVEEVAYTWFNRICAIRFMEVNDYLPNRVRVLSSEKQGKMEPDLVTQAPDVDLDLTAQEKEEIINWKMSGTSEDTDKMYGKLFLKQCHQLHDILPGLFEADSDYMELLFGISYTNKDDVIYMLVNPETGIPEADFNVSTLDEEGNPTGQVEIIGWLYQYYNTELKDDTFAKLKKNVKITKERIPAATQLFTPDWIVRYMVENSVGRIWIEHLRAVDPSTDEKATAERFGWKYYLPEAEQEESVNIKLAEIRTPYKDLKPTDITCIDPCMGSGHILVAMFDVLMDIYKSAGYSERDAAFYIVKNNIYGLDIDKRAYQLAYFAVMMKGRGYNRRFFRGKDGITTRPNVHQVQESGYTDKEGKRHYVFDIDALKYFTNQDMQLEKDMDILVETMLDAEEYGSILKIPFIDFDKIFARFKEIKEEISIFQLPILNRLYPLVNVAYLLYRQYDAVVTNPPYMGASGMSAKLSKYVKDNYPDSKSDLFAVFIETCSQMTKQNHYQAMITQHAWMFLSSFEKLRNKLLLHEMVNMAHLGARAFEEIGGEVVQTTSFVIRKSNFAKYKGTYCRLIEPTTQKEKENLFLVGESRYVIDQNAFSVIPGTPIAYWLTKNSLKAFNMSILNRHVVASVGIQTGDNEKFVHLWWEIAYHGIQFGAEYCDDSFQSKKWFPYVKGGEYRKWAGNDYCVVWWQNDGEEVKASSIQTGHHYQQYADELKFQPLITWSRITTGSPAFRYKQHGYLSDMAGFCLYSTSVDLKQVIGYCNSKVANYYLNVLAPTLNIMTGQVLSLPYTINANKEQIITSKVNSCISAVKKEWDTYEISWDFVTHPLVRCEMLADAYALWIKECDDRFDLLKQSEEELNRIFIDIYGLQEELTAEVEDKDISVRKADLQRDIKSLISYAVGCMFGRYSLDVDGLAYAGGEWDNSKYKTFIPDTDNCIPITDEEYFEDDIVGLFCAWLKKVYGEDTLEENLDFIANVLGNKGDTSRETIRNYFLKDFYADHLKVYQKRPIYWLFDSGKQNGFKTLIYMLRYDADTVGRVRTDYLHRAQKYVETAMQSAQYTIDNASSASEKSKATKAVTKYTKQLAEMKIYDEAIAHIANKRIEIDLDDGVKVNYAKFQGVEVAQEGKKALKIDLLAKIK